jgi:predicted ATPase
VAKALGRDPAEVEDRLDVLDRIHGFVSVVGEHTLPNGAPTMRCRFVHVLYQNALYDSLRATRRRSLNAAVANAMIEFHGDDSQSIASELAVLFEAAGDRERSAGYFLLAAQNTLSVCAFAEAVATAERGIALLSGLPQTQNRNAIELKLQIALGTACIAIQGYATRDVERAYGRARELCRRTGDSSNLASVLFGLFVHYLTVPLHETSLALGDEVLAIADREDNAALRVQGLLMHASTRFWTGDIAIGVPQLEEAIALYDYHRSTIGGKTPLFDHGVGCRRYQAASLWLFGFPQKAGRRIEEAIADARSLKDPVTLSGALGFASMLHYFQREVAATADAAAEAIACAKEYGLGHLLGFAATLHGWAVAQLADLSGSHGWEEGLTEILDSLNVFGAAKAKTFGSIARCLLAETYLVRQRFDEAESALHEGLRLAKETNEGFWEAELHRLLGKLALSQQLDDEAETHFERAIDVARTRLEKSLELRAFVSLYHLVRTRSDIKRTKNVHARLGETYVWFTEGFETAELREAKSLLRAG